MGAGLARDVRACGPCSIPGLGCGLSLLLFLVLFPGGFSPGIPPSNRLKT